MEYSLLSFADSDNRVSAGISEYLLVIEDNYFIMKECRNPVLLGSKFLELFRKPLKGWNNITIAKNSYVNIKTDILAPEKGEGSLEHYSITFLPEDLKELDSLFDYLQELNENNFSAKDLIVHGS